MILFCICFINWSVFWTALTAVGTIAMAVVTYFTLKDNKIQLDEMKRQWEEENKPKLDIKLVHSALFELDSTSIQIFNYGKSAANNIRLSFDNSYLSNIPTKSLQDYLINLQTKSYTILPSSYVVIPYCEFKDNNRDPGYILYNQKITLDEKYNLVDYLKKNNNVMVFYEDKNREPERVAISYSDISQRVTSIQDELSNIQLQLGILRTSLMSKKWIN